MFQGAKGLCFQTFNPIFSMFSQRKFLTFQVDPNKYGNIVNGFKVTLREDGARGLAKGWAPTFIGYSMQGLCKFGFYEVFKILYSNMLGEVRSTFVSSTWADEPFPWELFNV